MRIPESQDLGDESSTKATAWPLLLLPPPPAAPSLQSQPKTWASRAAQRWAAALGVECSCRGAPTCTCAVGGGDGHTDEDWRQRSPRSHTHTRAHTTQHTRESWGRRREKHWDMLTPVLPPLSSRPALPLSWSCWQSHSGPLALPRTGQARPRPVSGPLLLPFPRPGGPLSRISPPFVSCFICLYAGCRCRREAVPDKPV